MRVRRYYKAVRVEVRERLGVSVNWSWSNMVLPRVQVLLCPGGEPGEDTMTVALELSDRGGDPVVDVCLEMPWPWERPWQCELCLPPKHGRHDLRFVWRSPLR